MKIPGWSALVIVPLVIIGDSLGVIRRSESPIQLGLIIGVSAFGIALIAWLALVALDKLRR